MATITRTLQFTHQDGGAVTAEASYDTEDPYAVTFLFANGSEWVFARDLLREGAYSHRVSGHGDVRIWADAYYIRLKLSNGTDPAVTLQGIAADITSLLQASYQLTPAGSEAIDWDDVISELLA